MANYLPIHKTSVIFSYENIIRCPDTYILKIISSNKKYKNKFKEYIDFGLLETLSPDALILTLLNRKIKNPLEFFSIKEFDYEANYNYLHDKFDDLYMKSYPLNTITVIGRLIKSYCVDKIYIYNERYDKRQHFDICKLYDNNENVIYCSGDLQEIIDNISSLSVVYDWDADRVDNLTKDGLNSEIIFVLADYGFNFVKPPFLVNNLSERDNVSFFKVLNPTEKNLYKG